MSAKQNKPTKADNSNNAAAMFQAAAVALPLPATYEPPQLTPLGALQELLVMKTDVLDADWMDQGAEDPRLKL